MKYIIIYENYDYFYPENDIFCIRKYDNKIYFIINKYQFLPIGYLIINEFGLKRYIHIKWDINKIEIPQNRLILSKISKLDLDLIIKTIPNEIISKIEKITNFDLNNYIKQYKKNIKTKKYNL